MTTIILAALLTTPLQATMSAIRVPCVVVASAANVNGNVKYTMTCTAHGCGQVTGERLR